MTELKTHPHPIGMKNSGLNNCYYNSIMQCLCQTNTLITVLVEENQKNKLGLMNSISPKNNQKISYKSPPLGKISKELLELMINYHNAGYKLASVKDKKAKFIINNHDLLKVVGERNGKFALGKQGSCVSFFKSLFSLSNQENINGHKDSIKSSANFEAVDSFNYKLSETIIDSIYISPINKVFGGRSINCLRCKKCGLLNKVENNFNSLTLNVQHLIENVVEKKKLSKNKEKKIQKQNLRQKKIDRRKNVANIEDNTQKLISNQFDDNEFFQNSHTNLEVWYKNNNRKNGPLVHSKEIGKLPETLRSERLITIKENSLIRVLANGCKIQNMTTSCDNCSKVGNTEHEFRNLISLPPPVIMFELNIFTAAAKETKKLNIHVDLPPLLDISPYCTEDVKEYADCNGLLVYELFSIICHHGNSTASGHYNCFVKRRKTNNKLAQLLIGEIPKGN